MVYHHGGGRRPKVTPTQKKRLVEIIEAGPLVVGLETACWNSVLLRVLIWREFGVLYNRHYVGTLLPNLGFSFQKARCVSDHLDAATRLAWLQDQWPAIVRAATHRGGLILEFIELTVSVDKALAYFATHADMVLGLFGRYCEEIGMWKTLHLFRDFDR